MKYALINNYKKERKIIYEIYMCKIRKKNKHGGSNYTNEIKCSEAISEAACGMVEEGHAIRKEVWTRNAFRNYYSSREESTMSYECCYSNRVKEIITTMS